MTPRLLAAMNQRKTFNGATCKCGSTLKYTSSGACVPCDGARSLAYYRRIRALMKQHPTDEERN